ncbi:MAG: hypothetical protein AABX72_00780, partial [Nanoarchaeota archaeon]
KLKDDSDKKRKELDREKKKIVSSDKPSTPSFESREPSTPEPARDSNVQDMFRKMILWNTIILVLIVGFVGFFMFYSPGDDDVAIPVKETQNIVTGGTVIETQNTNDTNKTQQSNQQTTTPPPPTTYPGPEFDLYAEDAELGPFDSSGKIGGENLVVTSEYYSDAYLHLENKESSVIKCFIDRETSVDKDLDGKEDLHDYDLDFIIDELDPAQKEKFKESLPGSFKEGTYDGKGKVTVTYEARCYYCINPSCEGDDGGVDKNGESKDTAKVKFEAKPVV